MDFRGTCIENPFERIETLVLIVENAKRIPFRAFIKACNPMPEHKKEFKKRLDNFKFFCYNGIFFFYDVKKDVEFFYY